jgi:dipeptidyl aminopeptidase/acylaminoacyl peptidase
MAFNKKVRVPHVNWHLSSKIAKTKHCMRKLIVAVALLATLISFAQNTPIAKANYAAAARFSPKKLEKMLFSTAVDPHWLKTGDRFWYMYETRAGKNWYIVDMAKMTKTPLWDNAKLAAEITKVVKDPFDAQHLGIENLKFIKNDNAVQFEVKSTLDEEPKKDTTKKADAKTPATKEKKVFFFEYELATGKLTELKDFAKPKAKPRWASITPDKRFVLFSKKNNLYFMDSANYSKALKNEDDSTIAETALTTEGVEDYAFGGGGGENENNVDKEKNKNKRKPVGLLWSPDGSHFTLTRTDNRKVKDLWVINTLSEPRPTLETYKYQMPGEKEAPIRELWLFNWTAKTKERINVSAFKDQEIATWSAPAENKLRDEENRPNYWLGTNEQFYMARTSRDLKRIDVLRVDLSAKQAKPIIEERLNTYVENRRPGLIAGGKEIIEWSERDGWGHFYLYDGQGNLKNQITSGPWHAEDIEKIDEKNRVLYFTANGRETGEDPYYLHLYRVNFDGSNLKQVTVGNFDHNSTMDDNGRYAVTTYSRVNAAPKSEVVDANGKTLMALETTDMGGLLEAGYKFPTPFVVKAADGQTDLFGVMYKPFNLDSTKRYPIIEYVYPGPQTESVNKAFSRGFDRIDRLAQLGFVVVTVGNRGGHPSRSNWYHNYGYGNLRDYGLADKKAAIEQLADRHPFIDIDRVGIHGHSGGGFMSTAAMLVYPDFFKVAVSSAGNHDNSIYNRLWSEKHDGVKETISEKGDTSFVYDIDKNQDLAKNLKGHLMLSHGEIDNNVHPGNSIRVANALMKAGKRFEYVLVPGQRHSYGDFVEYFFWKMADFFSAHLLGDYSSQTVDITEMQKELEQGGKKN